MVVLNAFPYREDYEAREVASAATGAWSMGILYSLGMVLASYEFYKASLTTHDIVKYGYYGFFAPHIIGLLIVGALRWEMISKIVSFIGRIR
jgi:hypothetical protein